ncbi:hypothetical protein ANO14919_100850 [Xylariales sp. No.14919]|nr:hypothetical protein ANO14919_100850 [Xylariales sp. No.14919]
MAALHMLILISLTGTVLCQAGDALFKVVSPGQGEVVPADSTYTIRWSGATSGDASEWLGTCTITLLIGQQSPPLSKLWEIAYGIDLASGSFDWPVGFPTSSTSLGRAYALNITLDSHEDIFFASSEFHVEESDNTGGDSDHNSQTSVATTASSNTRSRVTTTTGATNSSIISTSETYSSQTNKPLSPITPTPSTTAPGDEPSSTSSAPDQQATGKAQVSSLSKGVIAGIVTAVVLYVVGVLGFIGFICYYKLGVLQKMMQLMSRAKHKSVIDGRYRKAELDCEGHEVNVTRRYELDATREIQEADGREQPAELDSHDCSDARPDSGVVTAEDERTCTRLIEMDEEFGR